MIFQPIDPDLHPNYIRCKVCNGLTIWKAETIDGFCSDRCRQRRRKDRKRSEYRTDFSTKCKCP